MRIGVVGAGMMGMYLAKQLTAAGHRVVVHERETQLGGLATHHDYGPFIWDRFYHVILPSDSHLIKMINDIGLGGCLRWQQTSTGYYVDKEMYSMSSNLDFLRFPLLSIISKFRLALTVLYASRINDWQRLEEIPVDAWLIRFCGERAYRGFWKPLLLAKLGENYKRVSAVFIWSYIKRLFSARDAAASREHLGYVEGGYKTVFDRLAEVVVSNGGTLELGQSVDHIEANPAGSGIRVTVDGVHHEYDKVVSTSPVNILRSTTAENLVAVSSPDADVEYLGVICLVLVTSRQLTPYYVVNIADPAVPFTGVIGMSNVVDMSQTAGLHLTYFPRYVHSEDEQLKEPSDVLLAEFMRGVIKMFPKLSEKEIVETHLNRAFKVQPIQVLGFSHLVPEIRTLHPDFYTLNTSQFVNGTLNNNEVVRSVEEFVTTIGPDLAE